MIGLKIRRVYYSSTEICKEAGIPYNLLRSWENKFPELHPVKNKSGRKCYKPSQLKVVKNIDRLKKAGYTDEKIHQILMHPEYESSRREVQSVSDHSSLISELKKGLRDILNLLPERDDDEF